MLLGISRSSVYYAPRGESAENLALLRRMDALSLQYPFYGSRQMARHLRREGVAAGRRRVRRLMRLMGLEAIYRKPRTSDAVTTVAAAGERGRQGTTRGVIYQPGSTLTKSATFPENRTTSVSRSLTGSSTVPVHREGGSRQRMSGPSTMSHPALWTCPACGRPLTVALNPEGGEAGAHRPLEISRASAAAHACAPAARFPQFHSASSSITGYEPASCQPWQPPVSAGAEDDEGVLSQSEYTLTKPSSCPNHRDHVSCPRSRMSVIRASGIRRGPAGRVMRLSSVPVFRLPRLVLPLH